MSPAAAGRLRRPLSPFMAWAAWAALAALSLLLARSEAPSELKLVTVARGLEYPWALAFLPHGRLLVTERPGRMRTVDVHGRVSPPLSGLPPVLSWGRCGLLDVVLDPRFAENRLVYWTFLEPGSGVDPRSPGDNPLSGVAVARGRLVSDAVTGAAAAVGAGNSGGVDSERLTDVRVIFRQHPKVASHAHCGSRMAFDAQGYLWVGLGDRLHGKDAVQALDNHLGKVVRIDIEGQRRAITRL